jgi:hypothetical protein
MLKHCLATAAVWAEVGAAGFAAIVDDDAGFLLQPQTLAFRATITVARPSRTFGRISSFTNSTASFADGSFLASPPALLKPSLWYGTSSIDAS